MIQKGVIFVRLRGDPVHTASVEAVDAQDVDRAHFGCPTNGHVGIRDGNDGWPPVL